MSKQVQQKIRRNNEIRITQLRVISETGEQLGILHKDVALRIAKEKGLDLVEVSPTANPPVCKIMDFSKFKYEQQKKDKLNKANAKLVSNTNKLKEIKFSGRIADNDYSYRIKHAIEFLEKGFKVKLSLIFRGREISHQEYGMRILSKAKIDLSEFSTLDTESMEKNVAFIIMIPKK